MYVFFLSIFGLFICFGFFVIVSSLLFSLLFFFLLKGGMLLGYNSTVQINEKIPCRCLILTQVNCSKKERGDIK